MALTDLLKDFYHSAQNIVRPAVLGLALAYCGPSVDDEREGCRDDNDCRDGRVCEYDPENGERYCAGTSNSNEDNVNGSNGDQELITDLCRVVWQECSGLPRANYRVGDNYNDCVQRGPEFLQIIREDPNEIGFDRNALLETIACVASGDYSCEQLESDYCGMPENDIYACFIDDTREC